MALGKTNAAGGGGTGGTLVVTVPVGVTVTATNETLGKTYTRVANYEGKATFKGLASGTWAITMSDGSTTTNPVPVVVNSDYAIELSFFSAYINVTYPAGSTCTATDGVTTLTAPDATGTWAITVPNAGTWTITAEDGDKSKSADVAITEEGQSESVTLSYELILFDGGDNTAVTGGWGIKGHLVNSQSNITVGDELFIKITGTSGAVYKVWPIYPMNTIDLSGHSTMKVNVKAVSSPNNVFSLAILTDIEINQSFASGDPLAQAYITGTGEFSLDISEIKGKCYPCIVGELNGGGASANMTATKIWLE